MFFTTYKKLLLSITHVWFNDDTYAPKTSITFYHDISYEQYISLKNKYKHIISKLRHSLIINLEESEEQLYSYIGKDSRYEINRGKKENIDTKIYLGEQIPREYINYFITTYNNMYLSKGLK